MQYFVLRVVGQRWNI